MGVILVDYNKIANIEKYILRGYEEPDPDIPIRGTPIKTTIFQSGLGWCVLYLVFILIGVISLATRGISLTAIIFVLITLVLICTKFSIMWERCMVDNVNNLRVLPKECWY